MLSSLTRGFLGDGSKDKGVGNSVIIKVDPVWGFAEFPPPGDVKKHSLPVFVFAIFRRFIIARFL